VARRGVETPNGQGPGAPAAPGDPCAEGLYALLAEHSRDVILFVGRDDGRILEANRAAAEAYGWSREELRGMGLSDLRAPEAGSLASAQLAEADTRGLRYETVHRRKDGASFPVEVIAAGATWGATRVLVAIVRDISERTAIEAALRESEDRLALAVEAAGLGLFYAVPYGPLYWSPRCREIFGVGDAPIPDFGAFLQLVHPADREQVAAAAARWLDPAGDGRYTDQYRCLRPDGTVRWVAASGIVRLRKVGDAHVPAQLVGTIYDITDQKTAQARLAQADRLASVGMLAAGVAHEINNPLTYLASSLELLAEELARGGASEEARQALADARDGTARIRHVIRDLRTFSGVREERRTRVALQPIVDAALNLAANELRYRARVVREFGPAPAVHADEARLGQVALNLVVNAAQAMPEGNVAGQELRVRIGTDARGWAVLEVSDTGSGIPPEIAERIFDPYFTTKPAGVGTGLGLSICRTIVTALGGEIAAQPRPERGTTMRVALPPAPREVEVAPEAPAPAAAPRRRGRVLVVDDEPSVGVSIQRLLAAEHDVEIRTRAEDVLDAVARGERFDAILFDLMMPGMTGVELHAAMARSHPEQARRMIAITAGATSAEARDFLARSGVPCCEKPFDVPALREQVRRLVE
jgi:PAS domain S-box-containing protein